MNKYQALNSFWNRFTIPFYDESSVPDFTEFPYGTYEAGFDGFDVGKIAVDASLWYGGKSWESAMLKTDEIYKFIGEGGVTVPYDDGLIWVTRRSPFARRTGDESSDQIRRVILGVDIEFVDAN